MNTGPGNFLISVTSSISIRVNESSHHKQRPNPLETSISCLPFCSTVCVWKEFRLWQTVVNILWLIGEILHTAFTVSSSFLLHHSSISPHYSSTRDVQTSFIGPCFVVPDFYKLATVEMSVKEHRFWETRLRSQQPPSSSSSAALWYLNGFVWKISCLNAHGQIDPVETDKLTSPRKKDGAQR